jgi:Flp pilus assembly protein TadB
MNWDGLTIAYGLIATASVGAVAVAGTLGYFAWTREKTLADRLTRFVTPHLEMEEASDLDERFESFLSRLPGGAKLLRDLAQIGAGQRPGRLLLYGLIAAAGIFLVVGTWRDSTAFAAVAFVGAIVGEYFALSWRAGKRWERLRLQLPEALHVVASALSAGASLNQALIHAAREVLPPLQGELRRVVEDVELGKTLEEALTDLQKRAPLPEFNMIIASLLIQQRSGGNLAQLLNETAELLKEDQRLRREMNVLTSQARASAQLIGFLPIGLFLYMFFFNPSYVEPLLTTQLGLTALGIGLVLEMIGFFIVYKIASYSEYQE